MRNSVFHVSTSSLEWEYVNLNQNCIKFKYSNTISLTFAVEASATVDDDDSDFLSRIFGSFLGDSDAAGGAEPVELVGSDIDVPVWGWSDSIFYT